jgi:hypothetical protein
MIIGGGFLIFWGYFKKNQENEEDTRDEKGWRSFRL